MYDPVWPIIGGHRQGAGVPPWLHNFVQNCVPLCPTLCGLVTLKNIRTFLYILIWAVKQMSQPLPKSFFVLFLFLILFCSHSFFSLYLINNHLYWQLWCLNKNHLMTNICDDNDVSPLFFVCMFEIRVWQNFLIT